MGEGRPLEEYLRDEEGKRHDAGDLVAFEGDALVDAPPEVCSMGGAAVQVTFANNSGRDIDIIWVDHACAEVRYGGPVIVLRK